MVVPGQRPGAVARGLVAGALDPQARARLLVGQQEAALDLEGRVEQAVEHREVAALRRLDLLHRPADDRTRDRAPRRLVDELDGHALEPERGADALADREQQAVDRDLLVEVGRHAQHVLERLAVAGGHGGALGVLDGLGGVVGQRREHAQVLVGGPAAAHGLVDGHDPEDLAVAAAQRHEERVLGVPGVRVVGGQHVRDVADRRVLGPVELVPGQQEAAVALEVGVEQRAPLRPRARLAQQRLAPLLGAVHGLDPEVVPRRAVDADDDGAEPEGLRDGRADGRQKRVEVVGAACQSSHLEQAGEPGDHAGSILGGRDHPLYIGARGLGLKAVRRAGSTGRRAR